jgi:HSP20 family protein
MRGYPFNYIMHEMGNLRGEIGEVFDQIQTGRFLQAPSSGVLPALRGVFRVDVREHNDEVIVVVDLPGIEREMVSLKLINSRLLEIVYQTENESEKSNEHYYIRERRYGNNGRNIVLPTDVTNEGATATFKNGVLEIHMKKAPLNTQIIEITE